VGWGWGWGCGLSRVLSRRPVSPGQRVREPESHGRRVVGREAGDEAGELAPDAARELGDGGRRDGGDAQFFFDEGAQLGVQDADRVAVGVLLDEFLES